MKDYVFLAVCTYAVKSGRNSNVWHLCGVAAMLLCGVSQNAACFLIGDKYKLDAEDDVFWQKKEIIMKC